MANIEEKVEKMDFEGIVIGAIITALAFVMGLFWRDAITETINTLLPEGEGLVFKYIVAILATMIIVIAAYLLIRFKKIELTKIVKEGHRTVRTKTKSTVRNVAKAGKKTKPKKK